MRIDLSYPIHEGMFRYPGNPAPRIDVKKAEVLETFSLEIENAIRANYGRVEGGARYAQQRYKSGNTNLSLISHNGTHVDAPAHKLPNGMTIDSYEIDKFVNRAKIVNLKSIGFLDKAGREISEHHLRSFFHSSRWDVGALIFYTGFCDEMAGNEGIQEDLKRAFEKGFSFFTPDAAEYIVGKAKKLNIVGIDSLAVDPSGSNSEAHRIFFDKGILVLETLANLGKLAQAAGNKRFDLHCAPINYKGADAAQTRAYAIVENGRK
jgi:arylformamidase